MDTKRMAQEPPNRSSSPRVDLLVQAVKEAALPAGQIAADCLAVDLPTFLTLVDDLKHGRLKVVHGKIVRDYTHTRVSR